MSTQVPTELDNTSCNKEFTCNETQTDNVDHALVPFEVEDGQPVRSKRRIYTILAALYLAEFCAALNQTIVATAIPTICTELHSAAGYTWIGGAYLLANAASAPIWAKVSDIWGRKPILLAAVGLFFISSIICATSVTMTMLIAARSVQGVAGGGIFQLVVIVISDIFSMRTRTIFFGFMEVIWALASGVGPVVGGAFAQGIGWPWIWWINLPLSGLAFILLLLFLNVHNPKTRMIDGLKALDWAGTLSILAVTLMVLLGLEFGGQTFPWGSSRVICLIVFGSLMSLVFIWCEKRVAKFPLMPMSIFGNRSNVGCMALNFVHAFVFIAPEYYLPLYLQAVKEASPLRSGILILPLVVMSATFGMITGFVMHKTGRYLELIWAGAAFLVLGAGLYILLDVDTSTGVIIGIQLIGGTGAGLLFQPPMVALQANTKQDDIATASAAYSFVREIAEACSIVLGGVVFQNGMSSRVVNFHAAGAPAAVTQRFSGAEAAANSLDVKHIADQGVRRVAEQSYAYAMRNMWILYTALAGLGLFAAAMIKKWSLTEDHTETKTGLKHEPHESRDEAR